MAGPRDERRPDELLQWLDRTRLDDLDPEKPRLVADLGDRSFLMLRNHGLLTVADNIADSFLLMYIFESTCGLFDQEKRRCTVYEARPGVCRQYPDAPRCGYYDFLSFEREQQGDPDFIALT